MRKDKEVVTDQGLVTSRHPGGFDFCAKLVEEIAEGRHERRAAWREAYCDAIMASPPAQRRHCASLPLNTLRSILPFTP